MIHALLLFNQLKALPREGWRLRGVKHGETVAAHSWGTALLTLLLLPPTLNKERALSYAIIHDLAEVLVGDITPHCGVSKAEKARREQAAMRQLCQDLTQGEALLQLWLSYEEQRDAEARFVKQLDRLDMAIEARAQADTLGDATDEFFQSAERAINEPALLALFNALKTLSATSSD